jgi:hypothetical protein
MVTFDDYERHSNPKDSFPRYTQNLRVKVSGKPILTGCDDTIKRQEPGRVDDCRLDPDPEAARIPEELLITRIDADCALSA